MRRRKGFTLIELLVVISIIILLIGILLPALGTARQTANRLKNSTQIRGIHQSMVVFAQDNNSFYPGRNNVGNPLGANLGAFTNGLGLTGNAVQVRFGELIDGFVSSELLISPLETDVAKSVFAGTDPTANPSGFDNDSYSYALLEIAAGGQRRAEWSDTTGSEAVVIGDRIDDSGPSTFAAGDITSYDSIHATGGWEGTMGFNDNHVVFRQEPTVNTRYGNGGLAADDNVFVNTAIAGPPAVGVTDNAWLVGIDTNTVPN